MRYIVKTILRLFILLLSTVLSYILFSFLLSLIPVNSKYQSPEKGNEIFIISNGVHTEIGFPYKTNSKYLNEILQGDSILLKGSEYVSFGMGQQEFYLTTPNWSDFKLQTGIKAIFPSTAIMHVSYYKKRQPASEKLIYLNIRDVEMYKILNFIENSFKYDFKGNVIPICLDEKLYFEYYESNLKYHLFNTCNNWTGKALKDAGIRTSIWSPFANGIVYQASVINKK
jgi:uncharacterized protein (TIGR02117 family)